MSSIWIIGALINIVGGILINLGTNVMKLGHNKRDLLEEPEPERPTIYKFKEWRIGIGIYVVGNLCNFASFAFAAQSLLSALGAVQFLANVFFASLVLKEKVTPLVIIATAAIVGGCLLLVIFGSHDSATYNATQLMDLYAEPLYIIFLVMTAVFSFGSYICFIHGRNVVADMKVKGQMRAVGWQSFWRQLMPVAYSLFSGLIGTQSVVFSKSLSVLIRLSISGENQMTSWFTYVMLVCFLITAGFYMMRLNQGLSMFDAMLIVPMMQISWTLFSILSGMIYWKEYKAFTVLMGVMFSLGVVVVLVGVYLLTLNVKRNDARQHAADEKALLEAAAAADADPNGVAPSNDGDTPLNKTLVGRHSLAGSLVHNPVYDPNPHDDDPNKHRKHDLTDTLIFTSLASTMGGTKTNMNHSLRKPGQRVSQNGASLVNADAVAHNALNSTAISNASGGKSSLMDTLKQSFKAVKQAVASDFSIIGSEGAKGAVGLNPNPTSLASTLNRSGGRDAAAGKYATPRASPGDRRRSSSSDHHGVDIMSSLPSSRFFAVTTTSADAAATRLATIKEMPSMNLAKVLPSVTEDDYDEEDEGSSRPDSLEGGAVAAAVTAKVTAGSNGSGFGRPSTEELLLTSSLNSTGKRNRMKSIHVVSDDSMNSDGGAAAATLPVAPPLQLQRASNDARLVRDSHVSASAPFEAYLPSGHLRLSALGQAGAASERASPLRREGGGGDYSNRTSPRGANQAVSYDAYSRASLGNGVGGGGSYAPMAIDVQRPTSPAVYTPMIIDIQRPQQAMQYQGSGGAGIDWDAVDPQGPGGGRGGGGRGWQLAPAGGSRVVYPGANVSPFLAENLGGGGGSGGTPWSGGVAARREHPQIRAGDYSAAGYVGGSMDSAQYLQGAASRSRATSPFVSPRPFTSASPSNTYPDSSVVQSSRGGFASPRMYSDMLDQGPGGMQAYDMGGGGGGIGGGVRNGGGATHQRTASGQLFPQPFIGQMYSSAQHAALARYTSPQRAVPSGSMPRSMQGGSGGAGSQLSVSRAWSNGATASGNHVPNSSSNSSTGGARNPSPLRYGRN